MNAPTTTAPTPEFERDVERRAMNLCLSAEPHGADIYGETLPCVIHISEARKVLFADWQASS